MARRSSFRWGNSGRSLRRRGQWCRKASCTPFVSPATRFVAEEKNAVARPLAEMGSPSRLLLSAFPCWPVDDTLTLIVRPNDTSRTNTSITRWCPHGRASASSR